MNEEQAPLQCTGRKLVAYFLFLNLTSYICHSFAQGRRLVVENSKFSMCLPENLLGIYLWSITVARALRTIQLKQKKYRAARYAKPCFSATISLKGRGVVNKQVPELIYSYSRHTCNDNPYLQRR